MQFASEDVNGIRRIDADAHLPAVDLKYGDDDVLAYLQGFAGGAGEDEHGSVLWSLSGIFM